MHLTVASARLLPIGRWYLKTTPFSCLNQLRSPHFILFHFQTLPLQADLASLGPPRQRAATLPSVPFPLEPKPSATSKLYIVKKDWSPEKDDWEVIPEERMSPKAIRKGQVFDIVDQEAFWWRGRLVRDASPASNLSVGKLVWLPSSQLERKRLAPLPPRRVDSLYTSIARR